MVRAANSLRLKPGASDMGPQMRASRGCLKQTDSQAERPRSRQLSDARTSYRGQAFAGAASSSADPNSLAKGMTEFTRRYDRRLADVTTKAAIPEIAFLWESMTRVKCPALVCRGEESPILDDEIASRMVRALPDGRLFVFRETGHSLPRLQPERFASMVRGFLLNAGLPAE